MTVAPLPAGHDEQNPLNGAVDAWIRPRALRLPGSDAEPAILPANGVEAAAMLGGFAACVLDGRDVTQSAVMKSTLQEEAVAASEEAPRNIYEPVCPSAN